MRFQGSDSPGSTLMKADTFAKFLVLQAVVDAEVGWYLEHRPGSTDRFREALISRVSDLLDQIDNLDAVAAARTYDAIVDFLAQIPEDDAGIVEAALRFRSATDRTVERGMDRSELRLATTWAVALHHLLEALASEYAGEPPNDPGERLRQYARAAALLERARMAAERIAADVGAAAAGDLVLAVERLNFAVRHRRVPPREAEPLLRAAQRQAARHRPSPLSRVGAFVLSQILTRDRRRRRGEPPGGKERRRRGAPLPPGENA